jgi:hypothetical protein
MNFRILKEFPRIFNRIKDFRKVKYVKSVWSYFGSRPHGNGLAGSRPRRERPPPPVMARRPTVAQATRRGSQIELAEVNGRAPGNTNGVGAHWRGRSLVRWQRRLLTAAFRRLRRFRWSVAATKRSCGTRVRRRR